MPRWAGSNALQSGRSAVAISAWSGCLIWKAGGDMLVDLFRHDFCDIRKVCNLRIVRLRGGVKYSNVHGIFVE